MWTFRVSTLLKTLELEFELGKKFTEVTCDGRLVQTIVRRKENVFTVEQTPVNVEDKKVLMTFGFFSSGVVLTLSVEGSDNICTQRFKRM